MAILSHMVMLCKLNLDTNGLTKFSLKLLAENLAVQSFLISPGEGEVLQQLFKSRLNDTVVTRSEWHKGWSRRTRTGMNEGMIYLDLFYIQVLTSPICLSWKWVFYDHHSHLVMIAIFKCPHQNEKVELISLFYCILSMFSGRLGKVGFLLTKKRNINIW